MRPLAALLSVLLAGCALKASAPAEPPLDARGGHAPRRFDRTRACAAWSDAVGPGGEAARDHTSFPELDPGASCFVPIRYGPGGPEAGPVPPGCGYPAPSSLATVLREAARYRAVAAGEPVSPLPIELACALPADVRAAAARSNARTLESLAERLASRPASGRRWPYAAVSTFGFGHPLQSGSPLVSFRPGDACPALDKREMARFSINITRAGRAAEAYFQGIAPIVTLSGGAVHGTLTEAFMLDYIATCKLGVRADRVLLDPCADHTHTNLRNTASLLVALGARAGLVVTDDGMQSGYLQEWTLVDLIGGSIDQRSLRDFGHLVGSFREAGAGRDGVFWLTPYRFWADPPRGLGGFACDPRFP